MTQPDGSTSTTNTVGTDSGNLDREKLLFKMFDYTEYNVKSNLACSK